MTTRTLVFELHHLGDAVLAIPFLRAAAAQGQVRVVCTASVAGMLRAFVPEVSTIVAAPTWVGRCFQAATALRRSAPQVAVSAWSDARVHVAMRLTGAPRRIGFPMTETNYYASEIPWRHANLRRGQQLERAAGSVGFPLLTDPLARRDRLASHLSNWNLIAERVGHSMSLAVPWFEPPPSALPDGVAEFIAQQRAEGCPVWAVHPGGRLPTKRWPAERFNALLSGLSREGNLSVVAIESPDGPALTPIGPRQLRCATDSHAALAALLARVDGLCGNDSYPAHVAAALGKVVVPIFGSGRPEWFAPFGAEQNVVQRDICPHHPCVDRCRMPSTVCLEAVTVSDVMEKIRAAPLRRGGR